MKEVFPLRTKVVLVGVWFSILLLLGNCSTVMEEHRGAAVGAGAGAATGAVAGALIGKGAGAVVLGGLIGGLIGGAVGHYAYDQPRSREETAKVYNYQSSQGPLLTIENASAVPGTAHPGGTVDLKMTYALLAPSASSEVEVNEIREITYRGQLVGNPEVRVRRMGGTYNSTVPLRLPPDAGKGQYKVKTVVQSINAKDAREFYFTVQW
jgi:hypothetical protein